MMQRDDVESKELSITTPDAALPGDLNMPRDPRGLVLFAHGSGSSRLSPRNRYVAAALNHGGLATLLFDLLTPEEHRLDQATAELRFDIDLLSRRLGHAVDWVRQEPGLKHLSIGLFGASTGAAAALNVAASRPEHIAAVVSRGGRPDLAERMLSRVRAPTLLIIGGLDRAVIGMNRSAAEKMDPPPHIEIVPGATHLFEEAGKLEEVARLAREWFVEHL